MGGLHGLLCLRLVSWIEDNKHQTKNTTQTSEAVRFGFVSFNGTSSQ